MRRVKLPIEKLHKEALSSQEIEAVGTIVSGLASISLALQKKVKVLKSAPSFVKLTKAELYDPDILPQSWYSFLSAQDFESGNIDNLKTLEVADDGISRSIVLAGAWDNPGRQFFTPLEFAGDTEIYVSASDVLTARSDAFGSS